MSRVRDPKAGKSISALMVRFSAGVRELLDMMVGLYMVALMVVMPLYTTESGYQSIGTEKCLFFRSVSVAACRVILPAAVFYLICRLIQWFRTEKCRRIKSWDISVTDVFAFIYFVAVIASYLHTSFRKETEWGDTFHGTYGWYLGLLTQLLFLGIYLMVSRLWHRRDWMIVLWIVPMTVVCVLGYLNRFGIYPLEMKAKGPQYISTIGNINWYCGYLVTVLSVFAYYLWKDGGLCKKKWIRMLLYLFLGVGLATLVTQGSSSGAVALLVLLGVFYLLSMRDGEKLRRFWAGCILLSAVCILTWVIRHIWPEAITYTEGTTDILTLSPLPFLMLGISLLCWYLVRRSCRNEHFTGRLWGILGIAVWAAAGVTAVVFIVMLALNTRYPGSIGSLSELGMFTFNASWGSNRGITWTAGISCFLNQNLAGKLLGVGPDAMAIYIHSGVDPALKQMVEDYFGRLMLTNAHNEWLTVLINEGLLGAAGYIGLMVTAIRRYLRAGGGDALAGAAGMGILAYTVNNVFSFQQVMSTSAVFLILGIGEACMRSRAEKA
ncbi:MAG: O-antigen ligase family protein [Acetatifactor sp.]|nr:O-antigen ligase family protein [Acetatifactor sp.]